MKHFCYLALALPLALLSCKKESPAARVSACGVKDPGTNLPWLREMIEEEKEKEHGSSATIRLFEYKGTTYFDYTNSFMSCVICRVYDCDGNPVSLNEAYGEDEYPDFINTARGSSAIVIWKGKEAF